MYQRDTSVELDSGGRVAGGVEPATGQPDDRRSRPRSNGSRGSERFETVIVGGGQAGLAVGYHLAKRGRPFVILDENERIGDNWRQTWDSLRLFTPARYNGLPGMAFPAPPSSFATRDEMAAFLNAYATRFELPVRSRVSVDGLRRVEDGDGYVVSADGHNFEATQVVVATGPQHLPRVPDFARELDPGIRQLHSSEYRNLSQLEKGGVLVVGASHSGADIALEAAGEHRTVLSGAFRGQIPFDIEGRPARVLLRVLWFIANRVLTVNTPLGRKLRPEVRFHGGPLVRVKAAHLQAAGVEHVPARTVGVRDGMPMLEDGRLVDVSNVIWCTGFRLDFGWIQLPVIGEDGYPHERRGVVASAPGLYFAGLPFQYSFASMLIGGAGRDAEYIGKRIEKRVAARGRGRRPVMDATRAPTL